MTKRAKPQKTKRARELELELNDDISAKELGVGVGWNVNYEQVVTNAVWNDVMSVKPATVTIYSNCSTSGVSYGALPLAKHSPTIPIDPGRLELIHACDEVKYGLQRLPKNVFSLDVPAIQKRFNEIVDKYPTLVQCGNCGRNDSTIIYLKRTNSHFTETYEFFSWCTHCGREILANSVCSFSVFVGTRYDVRAGKVADLYGQMIDCALVIGIESVLLQLYNGLESQPAKQELMNAYGAVREIFKKVLELDGDL